MIEVEFRGPLTAPRRKKVLSAISHIGKKIREVDQLTIFCDTQSEHFGNFYDPKLRLAIQLSKELPKGDRRLALKVKGGHWGKASRQETVLDLDPNSLAKAYRFLESLGIIAGCPRFYHRLDFAIGDINLSLKDSGLAPDHWEIELEVDKENVVPAAKKRLNNLINKLDLTAWTEDEYRKIITKIYQENPPILFTQVDTRLYF